MRARFVFGVTAAASMLSFALAGCGGDDSSMAPVDGGGGPADATSGGHDAGMDVNQPPPPRDASPDSVAPPDAPSDGTASGGDAGDAPAAAEGGTDAASPVDAGTDAPSPTDAASPLDAGVDAAGPVTFLQQCSGVSTKLTGHVFAPDGVDVVPRVRVYDAISITPFPAAYCDKCSTPIDPAYASVTTAADGSFTLVLDGAPASATIDFAIQIGRFRKHTVIPVTACQSSAVVGAPVGLPGTSAAGDIPKIAVAAGNVDHVDTLVNALGITEYDCVEGRKNSPRTATATCPLTASSPTIADVLSNSATLSTYDVVLLSSAPGAYAWYLTPVASGGGGYSGATMTANTQAWAAAGGRLYAADTAYDYVGQAFPAAIAFAGPGGSPQPVDGAEVGCAPGASPHAVQYTTTIDDPLVAAWLTAEAVLPSPTPSPATVPIAGYYQPWSVMSSLGASTSLLADATMPIDPTITCTTPVMMDVPLAAQFDVPTCGRVAYTSFHSYVAGTVAQAKLIEYMLFGLEACHN
jgi:hypothetical protein